MRDWDQLSPLLDGVVVDDDACCSSPPCSVLRRDVVSFDIVLVLLVRVVFYCNGLMLRNNDDAGCNALGF